MKKVKIKHRLDNAVAAFFAAENSNENRSLVFADDFICPQHQKSAAITEFAEKGELLLKILKRTFFFFPGAFFLFLLSFVISFNFLIFPIQINRPLSSYLIVMTVLAATGLMTWYGIGSLKNSKHIVIPLSISLTGFILGIISGIMPSAIAWAIFRNSSFPIYFFPAALIAPFLAKGLADRTIGK